MSPLSSSPPLQWRPISNTSLEDRGALHKAPASPERPLVRNPQTAACALDQGPPGFWKDQPNQDEEEWIKKEPQIN